MARLDDAIAIKNSVRERYLAAGRQRGVISRAPALRLAAAGALAGANVHALGVGRKLVRGRETGTLCIRLYVVQKLPLSLVSASDVLPPDLDGVPTDVIETAPAFIQKRGKRVRKAIKRVECTERRRNRQRPVLAGLSVAHHQVTAGTLGCFCRSIKPGDPPERIHALSNNHVFADVNRAAIGDDLYQPGPADGGGAADRFARLSRFVEIRLDGIVNRVDAAIGEVLPDVAFRPEVCGIGRLSGSERAAEGLVVRKHGRTTGLTEGRVTDVYYDAIVGMDHADPTVTATFVNQVRIERISPHPAVGLGGDSGSLVVRKDRPRAVGLYFAGPAGGEYGIANPIEDVLREVQIALV